MVRNIINTRTQSRPMATYTPFTPLTRVISQLFDEPFFTAAMASGEQVGLLPLDISEDDQNYIVRASLPGFSPDDVNVEFNEGVLTIRAEKSEEESESNERWLRRERRWGALERKIVMPGPVQENNINADFNNGVLELRLGKVQKAAPKKISIKGGQATPEQRRVESGASR